MSTGLAAMVVPPNAANAIQQPLTPITLFLRYLHMGTTGSSVPVTIEIKLEEIQTTLACVTDLTTQSAPLVISTIREVYQSKSYVRVDYVLIALAYSAKQVHSEELRRLANNEAITLISDPSEFLLFIGYCAKLSVLLRGNGHQNFGHGMCRVIEKWYGKHSPLELANMFGEHRSLHNWTHKSVIMKSHMRTKKRTAAEAAAATATATETASAQNGESASNTAPATPTTSTATPAQAAEPVTNEDDREHVLQFVFCKGSLDYLQYLGEKAELGPAAKRLKELQMLKTNESVNDAVQSIQRHNFTLEQMPAHLLEKRPVWDAFLPSLSCRTLLDKFHTLKDFGFLNENSPFCAKFVEAFGDPAKFDANKICPIDVYLVKQLYQNNVRYLGTKKAEYYERKVMKRKITSNITIKDSLNIMFHQALFKATPVPANFFIVMDLRKANATKTILRNKFINCVEAALVLAYSIYVREKGTLVYTFTESKEKLKSLHDILPKTNIDAAKQALLDLPEMKHTFQSLATPIGEATAAKKKVDVFVVIVDSVARFCRQGIVPVAEFKEYKAKFNASAKYVVVNLARPKPDLIIPQEEGMQGFIELCGFHQDTPKILHALAQNRFT